ncbi:MAG: hypothetical protein ACJA0H_001141 [Francisellaceae bacterium]|jgi:hypothetical protein
MGDVTSIGNSLKWIDSVENVIDTIKGVIEDEDDNSTEALQGISMDMSLYELDLLVKEVEHLRKQKKP